ncbi:EcoAI/FtnUII family type I restriction enzme subunit R [Quisquiliibacterium transsilvanicum]|uniref:Type I restriction enzyme R subunit n=1 Tax=Quisquiliibacterium transsilvanicum TaxID=1549638 RepID=A0A7W8HI89_9BURK|nr:type I restriction endonuclease subunit R [Quisquiliibacterium transsilvanicum]MBB5272544.1 type I restriction enzyme R subunit [Quisquiliibacterium transsilvanicum]
MDFRLIYASSRDRVEHVLFALKHEGNRAEILFVDGAAERFHKRDGKGRTTLTGWQELLETVRARHAGEAATLVSPADIAANDFQLMVSRYARSQLTDAVDAALRAGEVVRLEELVEFIRPVPISAADAEVNNPTQALEVGVADLPEFGYIREPQKRVQLASLRNELQPLDILIAVKGMSTGEEGDVTAYPTPDELWAKTFAEANAWRDRFAAIPFEDKGGAWESRYYQEIAIRRVLEAISEGRDRLLLTLATGTGKTAIAFQIAWKLYHSRWNVADWKSGAAPSRRPRILFLADRNILADQAYNAFSAFPEDALVRIEPGEIRRQGRVPKNGSVFFTIFQTFMSGPGDSPYFGDYPPDFFDFIVIDECHRGGANDEGQWRAILNYFAPAVQLGLTATPKRKANADTYTYFGEPVYTYSLKDGINDGFLTPFKVKQIASTIDDYTYTPDDAVIAGEVVQGKRYVESEFNRVIVIPEREAYRVKLLMGMIDQREKTLVFCATQEHALLMRDLINQVKTSTDPNYCVRVTADDGAIGDRFLRDFQDNEKTIPTILTTSQKLSTGVDARNVRNIVLMRPVNSMIEFKQIIGRGTRLYDGKDYFTIYDFVKAHHHFADPEWDGEPQEPEPPRAPPEPRPEEPDPEDPGPLPEPEPPRVKTMVKLADGKARSIQSMTATTFWSADGRPMSAAQFLETLFGTLPEFFKDEDELRRLWGEPETRKKLLHDLADRGFGKEPLAEMQRIIDAEKSDLFDVLAYVAFASAPLSREDRAEAARQASAAELTDKQRAFLDFVLAQYVDQGVYELGQEKLAPLLRLRYRALPDAFAELGKAEDVRTVFVGFQKHLYRIPSSQVFVTSGSQGGGGAP